MQLFLINSARIIFIAQLLFLIPFLNGSHIIQPVSQRLVGYAHASPETFKRESQFEIINEWKYLDFEYSSFVERQQAISNG